MRTFEIKLPKPKNGNIELFVTCCLHIGHKLHNKTKALAFRDLVLKTKNAYAISLGDDIDLALPGDDKHNSMMFDEIMTPEEQYVKACEYWRPLAEKGKLLWTADSNHWWRAEAKTGISQAKHMNEFLRGAASTSREGRAPEWGKWMSLARVYVGKIPYDIHSWHGAGGGTTAEAAIRRCRAVSQFVKADIYLVGHFHKKAATKDPGMELDKKGVLVEWERTYGATGSFLGWHEGYAERAGLPPATLGVVQLSISSEQKEVTISL